MSNSTLESSIGEALDDLDAGHRSVTDPPTREELHTLYPPKLTWAQLKILINSGDLGFLQRHPALQKRYEACNIEIIRQYGSIASYLANHRLLWGEHDTPTKLPINWPSSSSEPAYIPPYFCCETPAAQICILKNEWPYAVPIEVEHTLIWSKMPVFYPTLVHPSIRARIDQDGLWGFTGLDGSPPFPSLLHVCLPAIDGCGMKEQDNIMSARPTPEESTFIQQAGSQVDRFIRARWPEDNWETAWLVNPPRLQSVPGLAHIHLFARSKDLANK